MFRWKMSRTFVNIAVLLSLLLLVVLGGFSITAFKSFEGIVKQRTFEENNKELRIISNTVKRMNEDVKAFTFRQLDDPALAALFEKKNLEYFEMFGYMDLIRKSFEINPIFHSDTLYSGNTGNFYSTLGSMVQKDTFFVNAIQNYRNIPVLKPIPRVLPIDAYNTNATVFTYFYFQTDSGNKLSKALGVNIDAAWLCDTLSKLKGHNNKAYIIDKTSRTFIDDSKQIRNLDVLNAELVHKIMDSDQESGSFETGAKKDQKIITYLWMPETNWVLVVEESNDFLNQSLQFVRKAVLQITLGIAIFALVAAGFIAYRIYLPIGRVFREVIGSGSKAEKKGPLIDEVKLLSDVFQKNKDLLKDYYSYKQSADTILLENYIKAVLMENNSIANQLTCEFSTVFGNMLDREMMLILLKIDRREHFKMLDADRKKAYRFIIMNVAEEVLDSGNSAKAIYIGEGQFIILAFLPDGKPVISWDEKIKVLQNAVKEFTGISLSAFLGGHVQGVEALIHSYRTANLLLKYSVIYSLEAILDPSVLDLHEQMTVTYDEKLEERILESIRAGDGEEAKSLFDQFVEVSSKGDIESFMLSMTRFSLALGKTFDIMNKTRIEKIPISMKDFYMRMASFESIDDLKSKFYEDIMKIANQKPLVETRHDALVESIKRFIQDHFTEDLSLKGIAIEFKLSQGYLGTIFRDSVGLSVMDFIHNFRLDKSAELLLATQLSIAEIMERTGFYNESSYYKLFKRRFGTTPKAYRIDKEILNKLEK
ncbi:AraC family transcriptional regulator [Paenibacillus roseipurpureus]|uniref:AraC family transcriptional regulator n=1 Tax=Paenibacillus roseopurpureus TaxID=2918901 RepID=A0AA96LKM9_9BACL|nr:AraC family transcriptional regulator [Paenibacillus sp. MBLB1832]WNR42826.1 AraC family transcriptional regulator [Paenibacillus sp. MBLB1832]